MSISSTIVHAPLRSRPTFPEVPEAPQITLGGVLIVFLLFCALALLRNTFALSFPAFYAEDGKWAGMILNNGLWDTAFNARNEFPVVGIVLLQGLGLGIVDFFFGGDISVAPAVFALESGAYLAFIGILPLLCMRQQIGVPAALLLGLALVCIPTGVSGDEIFGRLHNFGFYCTVAAQIVMFSLLYNQPQRWVRLLQYAYLLILMLTFPVVIGQFVVFAGFYFFRQVRARKASGVLTVLLFVAMLAATALALMGKNVTSAGGAVDLVMKKDALIEFGAARGILYPLVAAVYTRLTDTITLAMLGALIAAGLGFLWLSRKSMTELFDYRVFLVINFGLVLGAMLVTRNGLSAFFDHYQNTYPDRYFMGVNGGFLVLLFGIIGGTPFAPLRLAGLLAASVIIASWLLFTPVFELSQPRAAQRSIGTMQDVVCNWVSGRGVSLPSADPNTVELPIYPVTPDFAWRIKLPKKYFNQTLVDQCHRDDADN